MGCNCGKRRQQRVQPVPAPPAPQTASAQPIPAPPAKKNG